MLPIKKKTPSISRKLINGANKSGPKTVAAPCTKDCATIAFIKCSLFTKLGIIACLEGISNDKTTPLRKANSNKCHASISSNAIRNAVTIANTAIIPRVFTTNFIRFTLSATTPPHIEKNNIGPKPKNITIPSIKVESVNKCISQRRPAVSAHIPKFEKAFPTQNNL